MTARLRHSGGKGALSSAKPLHNAIFRCARFEFLWPADCFFQIWSAASYNGLRPQRLIMKNSTDDDPAVYLLYVFLMFAVLGVATAIAAFVILR